ncbi:hypothetical protein H310_07329 [Aphanomyces invadans]|uniref:Uncharacterized protein n=1 Tax=Aphanomyces invadans TaxID=157072 RepID=A0A024U3I7_9STRA|nr:hypothetical protein H310_07329 [Aphanomyces invadans]ETW00795.1 hypothetical protein H310_07329 [Aphanomyces invadans]|eukprot:XP_008870930.1 hypothetical protein H310_07329 [Aphanomyces invadans]
MAILDRLNVPSIVQRSVFDESDARLARFRLRNVSAHSLVSTPPTFPNVPQVWESPTLELPSINERCRHYGKYHFVYAMADSAVFFDGVVTLNLKTGNELRWEAGDVPSETHFCVPHPSAQNEDDGVLLTVVLDGHAKQSFLVVLDARDLTVVAKVASPVVVPLGFLGLH